MTKRVAVIAGDGIGVDVTVEALKALEAVRTSDGLDLEWVEMPYSADHYLETGVTMPDEQVAEFRESYDAIFVGALGDPRVPDMTHARDILLARVSEIGGPNPRKRSDFSGVSGGRWYA